MYGIQDLSIKDLHELVESLNHDIQTTLDPEGTKGCGHAFWVRSAGNVVAVYFNDEWLWDSENDEREYVNDRFKEPLERFVKRQFNSYLDDLTMLRFPQRECSKPG